MHHCHRGTRFEPGCSKVQFWYVLWIIENWNIHIGENKGDIIEDCSESKKTEKDTAVLKFSFRL